MPKKIKHKLIDTYESGKMIASIDECGLGCLAGPATAAVVIMPDIDYNPLWNEINDSKKLSHKKRDDLNEYIKTIALDYEIISISNIIIDDINILQARYKLYEQLINSLRIKPDMILVDGDKFKVYMDEDNIIIPHVCIEKGDSKYVSIAAASIISKVKRDSKMVELHEKYPMYNFKSNKGYGTKEHIDNINKYGICPFHRRTFGVCKHYA